MVVSIIAGVLVRSGVGFVCSTQTRCARLCGRHTQLAEQRESSHPDHAAQRRGGIRAGHTHTRTRFVRIRDTSTVGGSDVDVGVAIAEESVHDVVNVRDV